MPLENPERFNEKRKLRKWALREFGDGKTAPCAFCGKPLNVDSMTLDHYPIPACMGGEYKQGNVRPACKPCNNADSVRIQALFERAANRRRARIQFRRELGIDKRRASIGEFTYTIGEVASG